MLSNTIKFSDQEGSSLRKNIYKPTVGLNGNFQFKKLLILQTERINFEFGIWEVVKTSEKYGKVIILNVMV